MKTLAAIATGFAYAAGLLLLAAMAITCASVAGRNTGAWSLDGDFELVSLLSGAALALCLPLGQLRRGNIIVDALTAAAPPAVRAGLDRLGAAVLALVLFALAWRSGAGGLAAWTSGAGSMMLGAPEWPVHACIVPGLFLTAVIAAVQAVLGFPPADSEARDAA